MKTVFLFIRWSILSFGLSFIQVFAQNTPSTLGTGNVGLGTLTPTQKLHIQNGTILLNMPLQGNDGVNFRNRNGSAGAYGDWGIQYWQDNDPNNPSPAGLNFWKPNGNTAINSGTGIDGNYILFLQDNGKVQIGDVKTPGNYRQYVKEGILTEKVKIALVGTSNWADHVFDQTYRVRPLEDVEQFISQNCHLPDVPSADQLVQDGGIDVNEMFAKQMAKIEELTLYIIDLNKRLKALEMENKALATQVSQTQNK